MRITVMLFGPEAQRAGRGEVALDVAPGATCGSVLRALLEREPTLASEPGVYRLAVNHAFAGEEVEVREGDEVALIGAVSGG
jgi:molybdopterin converting factor small subunit